MRFSERLARRDRGSARRPCSASGRRSPAGWRAPPPRRRSRPAHRRRGRCPGLRPRYRARTVITGHDAWATTRVATLPSSALTSPVSHMGAHHDHHGVTPTRRPEDLLVRQTRDQMRSDLGPMSRASKSAYGVAHIASAFLSGGRTRMSPRNPPMKADEIRSLPEHPYAPVRPLALLKLRCDTASNSTMARRGTSVLTPDGGQWSAR